MYVHPDHDLHVWWVWFVGLLVCDCYGVEWVLNGC